MDLVIGILLVMLIWNVIKMVKAKTRQIENESKARKRR